MYYTKICKVCSKEFVKPSSCGLPEWKKRSCCSRECANIYKKKYVPWNKGKTFESNAEKLPCRICGKDTKYFGTIKNVNYGLVHCGSDECKEKSKELKNKAISEKHLEDYASGKREKRNFWKYVSKVSKQEIALEPYMQRMGFEAQYKFLTGVNTNKLPRMFWLDFAIPSKKIYVEIDGTVHRLGFKKEADERRDKMMEERGWRGIRVPSSDVDLDIRKVIETINGWLYD